MGGERIAVVARCLAVCALLATAPAAAAAKEGSVNEGSVNAQDARPAIDRAAPAKTERAVFALG